MQQTLKVIGQTDRQTAQLGPQQGASEAELDDVDAETLTSDMGVLHQDQEALWSPLS